MEQRFWKRQYLNSAARLLLPILTSIADGPATAADIRVLSPAALRSSVNEIIPAFEKSSGHKVKPVFGPAGALALRIQKDEPADVGIATVAQIEALQKQGKIISDSKVDIAKVGIGIFTRNGGHRYEVKSIEAFKRALLTAKSIGHIDPKAGAPSGEFVARLLSKLDVAAEIKPKIRAFQTGPDMFSSVAEGHVDIAFGQVTEILEWPRVQLIGQLPLEIQNFTSFASGVVALSEHQAAARAFIGYLRLPAVARTMKAKGLEPAPN